MGLRSRRAVMIMKISIVIPVYNEQESIAPLFQRLKPACQACRPFEIICIDDGSTDGSLEALKREQASCPELKIIHFPSNGGKSAALAAGFKKAQGDIVVTLDADLQNPPEFIPTLIEKIADADAVIGWRVDRQDSPARKLASRFANAVRNFFLRDGAHDSACALNAFRRSFLQNFFVFKGMHRFFPALMRMQNARVVEVKVPHESRRFGRSKYRTFYRGISTFGDLLALIWFKKTKLFDSQEESFGRVGEDRV